MIKDGRIGSVSIGAKVQDLVEEDDGSMKAVGVHGLELSLVAVPGDSHANFGQALHNNFVLKEEHWRIIYFLRDFFEEYKEVPTVREFCKEMKMSLYQLYELFPKGPIKGACRIAGLPKPAHCI